MLVELKNGETYNGHLVNCDTWMNIHLREVICTSKDGDRFWRMPECYIRGNTIKYLRVPDEAWFFRDVFTWSSMVDGYWKNGMVLEARQAFEAMPVKDVVSWTAMIQCYAKIGDLEEGLRLFSEMGKENINSTTFAIMLDTLH
ncbi:hypothetical protein M5K25_000525 [Dendrobium thyrsiflorum]|uniref:U6 snRNA-associated Sm-like protein LSm4 n=1 Tax=Dendrobium thyrsiflorum TaxID=117978 RepID=A0ABD0VU63_DENTH